jgi:hypothetical protein
MTSPVDQTVLVTGANRGIEIETPDGRTIRADYPKTIVKIVRFQDEDMSVGRTFRTIPGRKGAEPIRHHEAHDTHYFSRHTEQTATNRDD